MEALGISVDTKSGVPIYVQIVAHIRKAVGTGSLEPGDRLPTVRDLAARLGVAPNTVVRAYNELQRSGLTESRPGSGTVILEGIETAREARVEALQERIVALVRDAVRLGVSEDDLWARFDAEFDRLG